MNTRSGLIVVFQRAEQKLRGCLGSRSSVRIRGTVSPGGAMAVEIASVDAQ